MKRVFLLMLCLFIFLTSQSQDQQETPELDTDRPGATESANVVPQGFVQIESGFLWTHDLEDGITSDEYRYPASIVRIGVLKFAELRLKGELKRETEEITATKVRTEKVGFARTGVGFKIHLLDGHGAVPDAALLAHAIFPFGSKSYNAKLIEPDLILTFSNDLTDKLGLSYSLGGQFSSYKPEETETDPRKYDHLFLCTVQLSSSFSDRFKGFVEYIGEKEDYENLTHHLDTGVAWLLLPNLQLDVLGGLGLSKNSTDFFMETGVSFRLPR